MTTFGHNLILAAIILTSVAIFIRHFFGHWSDRTIRATAQLLMQQGTVLSALGRRWDQRQTDTETCDSGCGSCNGCPPKPKLQDASIIAIDKPRSDAQLGRNRPI